MKWTLHILLFSLVLQLVHLDFGGSGSNATCPSMKQTVDLVSTKKHDHSTKPACHKHMEKSKDKTPKKECKDDCSCKCCKHFNSGNNIFIAPHLASHLVDLAIRNNVFLYNNPLDMDFNFSTFHPPRQSYLS